MTAKLTAPGKLFEVTDFNYGYPDFLVPNPQSTSYAFVDAPGILGSGAIGDEAAEPIVWGQLWPRG